MVEKVVAREEFEEEDGVLNENTAQLSEQFEESEGGDVFIAVDSFFLSMNPKKQWKQGMREGVSWGLRDENGRELTKRRPEGRPA